MAAAGVWLGRRIGMKGSVVLAGVVLAALTRRTSARPTSTIERVPPVEDSVWPEAPVAQPFVPHTRAWDDLRAALSPVVHPPESSAGNSAGIESETLPSAGASALDATNPFIIDDSREDTDPPLGTPAPPFVPRTLLD
eukprot:gene48541-59444_t